MANEHYYRFDVLHAVIDFQVEELDTRFTDSFKEILTLGASFDPRHNFQAFKSEDVCKLALKYYPLDFSSNDMRALDLECGFFVADIQKDPRFENTTSVSDLCREMVEFDKRTINNDDVIAEIELSGTRRVKFS
ncbi:uncharacterized protein LOC141641734 [Silene latifolia]|uniref:uncharacterized protein LOC141641734 n=1 Tax=Silene latifolia TaxID=37657 RepID=UPI003D77DC46